MAALKIRVSFIELEWVWMKRILENAPLFCIPKNVISSKPFNISYQIIFMFLWATNLREYNIYLRKDCDFKQIKLLFVKASLSLYNARTLT